MDAGVSPQNDNNIDLYFGIDHDGLLHNDQIEDVPSLNEDNNGRSELDNYVSGDRREDDQSFSEDIIDTRVRSSKCNMPFDEPDRVPVHERRKDLLQGKGFKG